MGTPENGGETPSGSFLPRLSPGLKDPAVGFMHLSPRGLEQPGEAGEQEGEQQLSKGPSVGSCRRE